MSLSFANAERPAAAFDFPPFTLSLVNLREQVIVNHPVNHLLRSYPRCLLEFFELYAHFVYDFSSYVCALFTSLEDSDAKAHIYDNLLDEMGYAKSNTLGWKGHHGELYRHFLETLRKTAIYQSLIDEPRRLVLERASRDIAQKFYNAHQQILRGADDRVSIAAFSTIEGWVSQEYDLWRTCLLNLGGDVRFVDMSTIDLHCECDVEHSRVLDSILLRMLSGYDAATSAYKVNAGLIKGIEISCTLFDDIQSNL
jgi:hypothetical protein